VYLEERVPDTIGIDGQAYIVYNYLYLCMDYEQIMHYFDNLKVGKHPDIDID